MTNQKRYFVDNSDGFYLDDTEKEAFDAALSLAVKRNFQMLAEQALVIMKNDADNSLLEEKEVLKARLKKIEELESEE